MGHGSHFDAKQRPDRTPFWVGAFVAVASVVMVMTYSQVRFAENFPIRPQGDGARRAEAIADPVQQLGPEALRRLTETAPAAGPPAEEIGAAGDDDRPR